MFENRTLAYTLRPMTGTIMSFPGDMTCNILAWQLWKQTRGRNGSKLLSSKIWKLGFQFKMAFWSLIIHFWVGQWKVKNKDWGDRIVNWRILFWLHQKDIDPELMVAGASFKIVSEYIKTENLQGLKVFLDARHVNLEDKDEVSFFSNNTCY